MLSTSYSTSRNDNTIDQTSLQLITDDLLCGRQVCTIDKKNHPLLVPFLQKAKNEAISNGDQGIELKINRIMNQLTLSSPKKTPTKKQQQTPRKSKTTPNTSIKTTSNSSTRTPVQKDYSQYNEEVDQLMNNQKTFNEIESKNYTPIQLCIQQHRDEASKSQNYQVAKKYHAEYLSLSNYIKTLPKRHRHYGEEEYIDNLKYKYYLAIQYYKDLEERLNNESDQLDQSEQQITMDTLASIQEKDDEFEQEKEDIQNCKNFHPSSYLMNLRKTEKKCAKAFMYDEAEMRLKYSIELENQEKNEYIEQKLYELSQKKLRVQIDRQKQNELTVDKNYIKGELFDLKRKRLLRIAQAEIDALKLKIEELGDQAPDESELILYSTPPKHSSPKKTRSSIKFSQSYKSDSNISNRELQTPTEDSINDFTISQQNLKSSQNTNTNVELSSDGSTSINFDEENMQGLRRNFNSSKAVLIGTPNSRSIADLNMVKKDNNQKYDSENHQHQINRDKSNDYEFVFEENEEEENNQNSIPITQSQIDSSQKSILKKTKGKSNTKSKSIIINKDIKEDEDSMFLSDSTESEFHSEDQKTKRVSLSYNQYLSPKQESNKKPRERLKYDMYLRSPKPNYIKNNNTEISDDNSYSYTSVNNNNCVTSNYYSSEKSEVTESSATEIIYSSRSENNNSNYVSEYYNYYSDEEEEEEEFKTIEKLEYSYNYITEDGLESYN